MAHGQNTQILLRTCHWNTELLNGRIRYPPFVWCEAGTDTCYLQLYRHRIVAEGKRSCSRLGSLLPHSAKRALHIGRLVKWKRVDLLIDAFPKVIANHPDAELVIVGDGPELDNLKKQAAERSHDGSDSFHRCSI